MKKETLLEKGKDWEKYQHLLLDQYQLCSAIQLSYDTIESLKKDGVIPIIKIGKRNLFDLFDVKDALKNHRTVNEVA